MRIFLHIQCLKIIYFGSHVYQQNFMHAKIGKIKPFNKTEEKFQKATIIKRNKNIFDISVIDTIETKDSMFRRIPIESTTSEVGHQFSVSFLDTSLDVSPKLQTDIDRFKTRISTQKSDSTGPALNNLYRKQKNYNRVTKERRLVIDIEPKDEKRFNNFSLNMPNRTHTRDFAKYLSRTIQKSSLPQIVVEEPVFATEVPVKSKISEEKFTKQLGREGGLSLSPKFSSFLMHEIDPKRITNAHQRTKVKWHNSALNQFNKISDKQITSQFERIYHTDLMNFKKNNIRRRKVNRQMRTEKAREQDKLERWEQCDTKFFRLCSERNPKRSTLPY